MSQRSGLLTSQLCHSRFAKWIFYCSPSGFELYYIPLYLSGLQNGFFCFSILLCAIYLCICPEIVLSLWYTTERLLFDSLRRVARREKKTCQLPLLCGRRQAGGLPSFFFLYYLYLFVFLLFTSYLFFFFAGRGKQEGCLHSLLSDPVVSDHEKPFRTASTTSSTSTSTAVSS